MAIVVVLAVSGSPVGLRPAGPVARDTALGTAPRSVDREALLRAAAGDRSVLTETEWDARLRRLAGAGVLVLTEQGRLRPDRSTDGNPVQRVDGLRWVRRAR